MMGYVVIMAIPQSSNPILLIDGNGKQMIDVGFSKPIPNTLL